MLHIEAATCGRPLGGRSCCPSLGMAARGRPPGAASGRREQGARVATSCHRSLGAAGRVELLPVVGSGCAPARGFPGRALLRQHARAVVGRDARGSRRRPGRGRPSSPAGAAAAQACPPAAWQGCGGLGLGPGGGGRSFTHPGSRARRRRAHARHRTTPDPDDRLGKGSFLPIGISLVSSCLGTSEDAVPWCRNRFLIFILFLH
jgi:hypothetical protein